LNIMRITILLACLVFSVVVANNSLQRVNVNKLHGEKEVYLFATGYYHPVEYQDFYASGSYEKDLKLNGLGTTISGKKARRGHVAVDPSVIPLGTEFYTEEYGILKAEDTGGRIRGDRIDIFTGDGRRGLIEALKIRGWLKLKIIKWGDQNSPVYAYDSK
jgi:3D (Asp-Asp-Asp) domain-containing protein